MNKKNIQYSIKGRYGGGCFFFLETSRARFIILRIQLHDLGIRPIRKQHVLMKNKKTDEKH